MGKITELAPPDNIVLSIDEAREGALMLKRNEKDITDYTCKMFNDEHGSAAVIFTINDEYYQFFLKGVHSPIPNKECAFAYIFALLGLNQDGSYKE